MKEAGSVQILNRCGAECTEVVSGVEEGRYLDGKLFVDLLVVTVRATELVKMMSLNWIMDVGRLFELVELGQGWLYLLVKGCQ
jgi:hypothetical protein